jgi:hypothetical protein
MAHALKPLLSICLVFLVLLGMSFLSHFDMQFRGGTLLLR